MDDSQQLSQNKIDNETYLKIWQTEQDHERTRWTVVTFFVGISFAILGLSLQTKLTATELVSIRISSLLIYWFAYTLLWRFYVHTKFLRAYLLDLETSGRTTLDIQSRARKMLADKPSSASLIFIFGLIYTAGIVIFSLISL